MKRILLYIAFILPALASAQVKLTNADMRDLNSKIVDLLEEYEVLIQTPTDRASREFIALFENKDIEIYNDLLGLNSEKRLTVEEYATVISTKSQACKVIIKDIVKGSLSEDANSYLIEVAFKKYMQYYDRCGILFDSQDFYKNDHELKALIAMNKEDRSVHFRKMDGDIKTATPPLKKKYKVVTYKDARDADVLANGKRIKYNSFDQAILDDSVDLQFTDNDVVLRLVQDSPGCNNYSFSYKPRRWRIKPYVEFSMGDIYKFDGDHTDNITKSASMMEMGLDLGYTLVAKPKFKLSLFTGFGLAKSKVDLAYDGIYNYSYTAAADIDGDSYNRFYEVSNFKATQEVSQYVVPLYLDFDFQVSKRFSLYLQGGLKAYLNSAFDVTNVHADLYTYGIYPQYNNLKIENFQPIGFGSSTQEIPTQEIEAESMTFEGFAGAGFRLNLFKALFLDARVSYQMGTPLVKTKDLVKLDNPEEENALIRFDNEVREEQVRNVTDIFDNISRGGLKVNVGLLLKF